MKFAQKCAAAGAAIALSAAGSLLTAAPAYAGYSLKIDTWGSWGQPCGKYYCLYYSQGLWNASWRPSSKVDNDLGGNKFSDSGSFGSAGDGKVVRNNAASMGNHTSNCQVTTYIYPHLTGDGNYLNRGYAGNLTEGNSYYHLRNNEASITINSCS
ncbi:hypothetical protein GCM10022254_42670 [Actinomadura meridiana]|uniref:Peptidase inhibitor family I36 n=1 Tax=Actinomadura meridiana TaxID=559626 RepID=A0ABP8C8E3_9ACTN